MNCFLSGITFMGCCTASLFYLRFWKASRDRLFLIFSITFLLLGLDRIVIVAMPKTNEHRSSIFLIRLLAFLVLIYGIWDKNINLVKSKKEQDI